MKRLITNSSFCLVLLLTIVFQSQAADFTRVIGANSPGVIIDAENPECWFAPISDFMGPFDVVNMTGVKINAKNEIVEYYATGTQNGAMVNTHIYQTVYNASGQVTGYQEDRTYAASGITYHITVSGVQYNAYGIVRDGFSVAINAFNLIQEMEDGLWSGKLKITSNPKEGLLSDWKFLSDNSTTGKWTLYKDKYTIISSNAVGTYAIGTDNVISATYTGTAKANLSYNMDISYTLKLTQGKFDPNLPKTITADFKLDFTEQYLEIPWTLLSYQGVWTASKYLPNPATAPKPANLASNARSNTQLKWTAGYRAASHNVYFGTDPNLDPNTSFMGNQVATTFTPGRLELSTTYYWRIDEVNANGITPGTRWSFTVTSTPLIVQKCTLTALAKYTAVQEARLGNLTFSGFCDATADDFTAADANEITVFVDADQLRDPNGCIWTFPVTDKTFKKGIFNCTNRVKGSPLLSSLKIDTKTSKMTFTAKNVDLAGLDCPMTITIQLGSYSVQTTLDETLVNGVRTSCPIKLMMGVKDTFTVNNPRVRLGRKPDTDSFTAQGTFTLAENYDKSGPLVITLGTQTFTISGGAFIPKNGIESYKTASTEKPVISAKLDFARCTYTISITKVSIEDRGDVDFGINFFGVNLAGSTPVIIK